MTRIEKLDLQPSSSDGLPLSDQLIQPRFDNRAVALVVNVDSAALGGCPSMSTRNRTDAPRTVGPMTR
jgi:hypothetical protein